MPGLKYAHTHTTILGQIPCSNQCLVTTPNKYYIKACICHIHPPSFLIFCNYSGALFFSTNCDKFTPTPSPWPGLLRGVPSTIWQSPDLQRFYWRPHSLAPRSHILPDSRRPLPG